MKNLITKSFLALFGLIMFANLAMGQTIILEEGFESGLPATWLSIDDDGDGHFWTTDKNTLYSNGGDYTFPAQSGSGAIGSGSTYNNNNVWEPLTPDNWLISPDITGADTMSYWVRSDIGGTILYDTERYGIYVSSTGRNISDFTMIAYDSTSGLYNSYAERGVSLPAGTKYVAFRHYNTTDQGAIVLDDIKFVEKAGADINMSYWVELAVKQGEQIALGLYANAPNTIVKVVSGSYDTTFIVGTGLTFESFYAQADTMKVYGNLKEFNCASNYDNIKGVNVYNNKELKTLGCANNNISSINLTGCESLKEISCFVNNLSACGLDSVFYQLPKRPIDSKGKIYIKNSFSTNPGALSCRDTIAANRNWEVLDYNSGHGDIPIVNVTYACPDFNTGEVTVVNMNRWVELNVQQGQWIKLCLWADAANTAVKVVSGTKDTTFRVNAEWTGYENYYAKADTMKVYGNVKRFACNGNGSKITGLDASNNSGLTALYCFTNNISSIKISGCDSLSIISCDGNNLSACGLDSLFHQLPIIPADNKGEIYIKDLASTNPGAQTCRDTIATNRNWVVLDYNDGNGVINIVNTSYDCPDFSIIEEMSANSLEINIYPNPVNDNLNIECGERISNLELYDALGRMLIRKENVLDNTSIDVSNLENGIYILKICTDKGSGEYKIIVN
ncbi:MAG: T9SS type A sorting domain-containing protein [Bacteroidales bacterium]|nr:T9SS type A sorting domain-containing protein [Bacteroidales bacterium]